IKVAFWLIIIILGFMYIRSLAKSPVTDSTGDVTESEQVEATISQSEGDDAAEVAASESDAINTATEEASVADTSNAVAEEASGTDTSNAVAEEATATDAATEDSSSGEQGMVSKVTSFFEKLSEDSSAEDDSSATNSDQAEESNAGGLVSGDSVTPEVQVVVPETAGQQTTASNQAPEMVATAQEQQSVQDLHKESVTKILKEFDELRDAAQAEMEAKKNRMQAERELHEAMMPSPRVWRNPGYNMPYGPTPYQQGPNPYQQGPNPYQQGYYNYR
ncbi:MAG: hypothetical protein ABW107_10275, partial [Candidatus Thiodiazotropha sp. 6PLUC5]